MAISVEESVLEAIRRGSMATSGLVHSLRPITKQGVYRVLRKLKEEGKIVIHGKEVSLNLQWIKKMSEFFSLAEYYYSPKAGADSFLNLSDLDKVVYFFKNLNLLDSFASHILHMLNEVVDSKEPIYAYNPHEWFFYARQEAEEMLVDAFNQSKRQILITSIHHDPLDKELKKHYNNDLVQYDISGRQIRDDTYYFVVIGNYLIELFLDEKIAKEIDTFYKRTKLFDEKAKAELHEIVFTPSRNKLVISRNRSKIEKYKKVLSRNFFISSHII
ncbi:MAG: hypothetical protein HYT39_02470 [Candidatus Sungbacteria bacterium]|nr:hypothetical protein [Candidatus Sungbacteria bacterium]